LADAFSRRKETRIPIKMFVNLYSLENHTFEVAPTVDISCHGARVVTKTFWRPDQPLSVRSIRGNFYSRARVAYCQRREDSFVVGLEMYYPQGNWTPESSPIS
jgi:PilZ domain